MAKQYLKQSECTDCAFDRPENTAMPKPSKPPASRANDRRILLYFSGPSTREALDRLALADGLTRSQMVARLVEREAASRD